MPHPIAFLLLQEMVPAALAEGNIHLAVEAQGQHTVVSTFLVETESGFLLFALTDGARSYGPHDVMIRTLDTEFNSWIISNKVDLISVKPPRAIEARIRIQANRVEWLSEMEIFGDAEVVTLTAGDTAYPFEMRVDRRPR